MDTKIRTAPFRAAALAAVLALVAGCATQPPLDPSGVAFDLAPYVAAEGKTHDERTVIWGGMIIDVDNLADQSEIQVIAYPLDAKQRPLLKAPTQGRFLAVVPGYVERYDYPKGRFVTFRGRIIGTRTTTVGQRDYEQALLAVETAHVWPAGYQRGGPQVSFGIGVGIH